MDAPPYLWRAFPIVDQQRFFGFDLFCGWFDVFLMSFFYLLSGLFVWSSLTRKGPGAFLQDRLLRLGLPFAAVVLLLMPLTLYPSYVQSAGDTTIAGYWRTWLSCRCGRADRSGFCGCWSCGTCWRPGSTCCCAGTATGYCASRFMRGERPAIFLGGLLLVSALAYVPLALMFGPANWFQAGPFGFQLSRPLQYVLYFFAGAAIGACGIERGLFAPDGPLVRRWARWLVAAHRAVLRLGRADRAGDPRPVGRSSRRAACAARRRRAELCPGLLCQLLFRVRRRGAVRRGAVGGPARLLDSLKANAFGMYLVHYLFVVWLQFALLGLALPALVKAAIVFSATLALSWSATAALRRVPAVANIIGADRRPAARPAPPRVMPAE